MINARNITDHFINLVRQDNTIYLQKFNTKFKLITIKNIKYKYGSWFLMYHTIRVIRKVVEYG